MRFIVCTEGIEDAFTNPHRIVLIGALGVEGEKIPVVINYMHDTIVGWATDLQRDIEEVLADGIVIQTIAKISFEIEFLKPEYEAACKGAPAYIWANRVFEAPGRKGDKYYVTNATIRELSFFISGANPGAFVG